MTEAIGVGASTEAPTSPPWVVEGCDHIGAYQQCLHCGRVNRLTTNGLKTVTGAAMERARRWATEQWMCRSVPA